MITIEIKGKNYIVIAGTKAFMHLTTTIGADKMKKGEITFEAAVTCYWDGIREKGKLKKEDLEDYVDMTPGAEDVIFSELIAFKKLAEEAKK